MAAVGIAFLPLTLTGGLIRLKVLIQRDERNAKFYERAAGYACEAAASVRTIASLTREEDVVQHYHAQLKETLPASRRAVLVGSALYGISTASSFFAIAVVF